MKKEYLVILFILLTILLFIFSMGRFYSNKRDSYEESQRKILDYPSLIDASIEISGVVQGKQISLNLYSKGSFYVNLNNGGKFDINRTTRNYLYINSDIRDFLEVNDSISKHANNDSIFIYRDGLEYYFVLGKIINKDKKNQ
ncbi:hypothetical protein [Dysgonomonas sp. 25]|uniref:hypothetical protein n=1 Tax=Dysgonomonas sp. 25 TaxID=2302933 RepID=UPI0013D4562D|nr:hypothetical protein [Dysgonomonas sp. 25]